MRATRLNDSFKGFRDGAIGKVVSPEITCTRALKVLQNGVGPVLEGYALVPSASGIPQYRAYGAPEFKKVAGAEGTNGKGHTAQQALASALMEMVERYSCFRLLRNAENRLNQSSGTWAGYRIAPNDLVPLPRQGVAPPPCASLLRETPSLWYPGTTLRGEPVHLPLALLLHMQGTNGMTAGNSFEEALLHGLCEVIERHCRGLILQQNLETPPIDVSTIKNPWLTELIGRLQEWAGCELVLRDFSLGLGIPVVAAVRKVNAHQCLVTVGVATDPDEALARALTESSQGDNPLHYCRVEELSRCFIEQAGVPYSSLRNISHENMRNELETMDALLRRHGMEAAYADATDSRLGIPSAYVFVKGSNFFDSNVANRNLFSAAVSQSVFSSDWDTAGRLLEASSDDPGNTPFYQLCRGALLAAAGAYPEAAALYSKSANSDCAQMPLMETNLLRQTALAHLAVCLHASCRGAESLEALHRLHSLQADYDFHYLATLYPASFVPLMETRENFELLRLLHRKSPFELPAARVGKLLVFQRRRRELHMLSRQIETALAEKANTVLVSLLKEVDDLSLAALALAGLGAGIAAVLEDVGSYAEAIRYYREAEFVAPLNPQINIALARCYRQTGDMGNLDQQLERLCADVSCQEDI